LDSQSIADISTLRSIIHEEIHLKDKVAPEGTTKKESSSQNTTTTNTKQKGASKPKDSTPQKCKCNQTSSGQKNQTPTGMQNKHQKKSKSRSNTKNTNPKRSNGSPASSSNVSCCEPFHPQISLEIVVIVLPSKLFAHKKFGKLSHKIPIKCFENF